MLPHEFIRIENLETHGFGHEAFPIYRHLHGGDQVSTDGVAGNAVLVTRFETAPRDHLWAPAADSLDNDILNRGDTGEVVGILPLHTDFKNRLFAANEELGGEHATHAGLSHARSGYHQETNF